MHKTTKISVAFAALTALGGSALAQTPPAATPPAHHGFLHNLFHHNKPAPMQPATGHMMPGRPMPGHSMMGQHPMMGGTSRMSGNVIGNKNTHVFHLPGDKGALPAPQNRVYFRTAAQAMAAGYHRAGGSSSMTKHPMMHGSPMNGMPMHGGPMRLMPGTTR